ncbi:MAG TPA: alpha/beta fold hydrolase, partial [Tepidisphaeraceae bacterium]|nr:alpha/beta fold hydrolase [Tepidisphaeraceae bacterium]
RAWIGALLLAGVVIGAGVKSAEKETEPPPKIEIGPDGMPVYRHPYKDGLYSTVTAMNMFYVEEVKNQQKLKLKVPGFHKDVPVYRVLQDYQAPLVVVLVGVDGKVNGPWGDLFPYWFSEAGCHTLTFDSPFTPQYPEISGQGVVGNFDAEADQIAAIIAAYLAQPEVKSKVTKVGVLGMSMSGLYALQLAVKAKAGTLPFELSGCLALSAPLRLKSAARVVDRFFREDRWNTTLVELAQRFGPHVPVAEGEPIPFAATEMRAAIGFVFRDGLTKVVERNDRYYRLGLLPSEESGENRDTWAEATGFERFIETFSFAYWNKAGKVKTAEELWDSADVVKLLPKLPAYAQIVIAANDPFISADDIAAAQAADTQHALTVLPVGGHLGFAAADWTLIKALRIFGQRRQQSLEPDDDRTPDEARKETLKEVRENLDQPIPPADDNKIPEPRSREGLKK